jgi:hypothetical protein
VCFGNEIGRWKTQQPAAVIAMAYHIAYHYGMTEQFVRFQNPPLAY